MVNQNYIKTLVQKTLIIYRKHLNTLKSNNKIKESARITGIIFWLTDWLEIFDEENILTQVNSYKKDYLLGKDLFICGKVEGLITVIRLMNYDKKTHNMINQLVWTLKS